MAASYPSSIKTFTTKTNKVDLVDASHMNDVQLEVTAIETELGTSIKGTASDLKTRLAVSLAGDGSIVHSPSFPASGIDGQPFYRNDIDQLYIYDGSTWDPVGGGANTIFSWLGCDTGGTTAGNVNFMVNAATNPTVATFNSFYATNINYDGSTYYTVAPSFKWIKPSAVNTLTVFVRCWAIGTAGTDNFTLKFDMGGQSGTLAITSSQQTPTWRSSFTVNVTSLSTGTTYDGQLSAKDDNTSSNQKFYVSGLIIIGS